MNVVGIGVSEQPLLGPWSPPPKESELGALKRRAAAPRFFPQAARVGARAWNRRLTLDLSRYAVTGRDPGRRARTGCTQRCTQFALKAVRVTAWS
jgi:hypothetical protein